MSDSFILRHQKSFPSGESVMELQNYFHKWYTCDLCLGLPNCGKGK